MEAGAMTSTMDDLISARYLHSSHTGMDRVMLRAAAAVVASDADAFSKVAALSKVAPSAISDMLSWSAGGSANESANTHLAAVLEAAARSSDPVIDLKGSMFGRMFGSADVVYGKKTGASWGMTLVTYAPEAEMLDQERERLVPVCRVLGKMFPESTFVGHAASFTVGAVATIDPPFLEAYPSEVERFQFEFVDAMANMVEKWYEPIVERMVAVSDAVTPEKAERCIAAPAVAAGEMAVDMVSSVIRAASMTFPKTAAYLRTVMAGESSFCRGMPPPICPASGDEYKGSWAEAAIAIKDAKEGTFIAWGPTAGVRAISKEEFRVLEGCSSNGGQSVMYAACTGAGFFRMTLTDDAPEELLELAMMRKRPQGARSAEAAPLDERSAAESYARAEMQLASYAMPVSADLPSVADRASVLLKSQDAVGEAQQFVHKSAADMLSLCSGTIGTAMLDLGRVICSNALLACKGKGKKAYHVTVSAGGKVVQITRFTGTLQAVNDTSALVAVANPADVECSWVSFKSDRLATSKCLFLRSSHIEWMSKAPGAVAMLSCSYSEAFQAKASEVADWPTTASLTALADRKPLNIALQMERYYATSSASLASDFDSLVDKLAVCSPSSTLEKLLLFRMVVRGLSIALERAAYSLERVVVPGRDGRKTIAYAPVFSRRGVPTSVGLVNTFYDGTLASGTSSSAMRAAAIAYGEAVAGTDAYEMRKSAAPRLAYMASDTTVAAWKGGLLAEFMATDDFLESEMELITELAMSPTKYAMSLLAVYSSCHNSGTSSTANRVGPKMAASNPGETFSTKRALLEERTTAGKSTDFAFNVHSAALMSWSSGAKKAATAFNIASSLSSDSMSRGAGLGVLAVRDIMDPSPFRLYVVDKAGSIEKPRDISLISGKWRMAQKFVEGIGYELGRATATSALKAGSKIAVMQRLEASLPPGNDETVVLKIATDKSSYGPSKLPAGLYAAVMATGCYGPLRVFMRNFFVKLSGKRAVLPDVVTAAGEAEIAMLPAQLRERVARAIAAGDAGVPLTMGMMQGLCGGVADLQTAGSTKLTEEVLARAVGAAKGVTTNDDGAFMIRVDRKKAFTSAWRVLSIASATGGATGEVLNRSKFQASTIVADLNTQMLVHGSPTLPYVRGLASCCESSSSTSVSESALQVINSTNQAASEGAPMSVMIASLAIAWSCHYDRFRVLEDALKGKFASMDPLVLGPPVFLPTLAFGIGGWQASRAALAMDPGYNPLLDATARVAAVCSVVPNALSTTIWGSVGATVARAPAVDYVLQTARIKREVKSGAASMANSNSPAFISTYRVGGANSIASVMSGVVATVKAALSVDPYRADCNLISKAAASYAVDSQRLLKIVMTSDAGAVAKVVSAMTLAEALEDMSSGSSASYTPDDRVSMEAVNVLVASVRAASENLMQIQGASRLQFRRRETVQMRWPSRMQDDAEMERRYYTAVISPATTRASSSLLNAMDGFLPDSPVRLVDTASVADVLMVRESTKRLFSLVMSSKHRLAIVPKAICEDAEALFPAAAYAGNLGMSMASTSPMVSSGESEAAYVASASPMFKAIKAKAGVCIESLLAFRVPSFETSGFSSPSVSSLADLAGLGVHRASVDIPDVRLAKGMVTRLAAVGSKVVLTPSFVIAASKIRVSGILRRESMGTATAAEVKLTIKTITGQAVPYIASRVRKVKGLSYSHSIMAIVSSSETQFTIGRGGFTYTDAAIGESVRLGKDMIVTLLPPSGPAEVSVACLPPCAALVRSGRLFPLMDIEDATLSGTSHAFQEPLEDMPAGLDIAGAKLLVAIAGKALYAEPGFSKALATRMISSSPRAAASDFFMALFNRSRERGAYGDLADRMAEIEDGEEAAALAGLFSRAGVPTVQTGHSGLMSAVVFGTFDSDSPKRIAESIIPVRAAAEVEASEVESEPEEESEVDSEGSGDQLDLLALMEASDSEGEEFDEELLAEEEAQAMSGDILGLEEAFGDLGEAEEAVGVLGIEAAAPLDEWGCLESSDTYRGVHTRIKKAITDAVWAAAEGECEARVEAGMSYGSMLSYELLHNAIGVDEGMAAWAYTIAASNITTAMSSPSSADIIERRNAMSESMIARGISHHVERGLRAMRRTYLDQRAVSRLIRFVAPRVLAQRLLEDALPRGELIDIAYALFRT